MADKKKTRHEMNPAKETDNKEIGCLHSKILRELRENRGRTQEELANEVDMSVQTISRLERQPSIVGTNTLVKLADFFNVPYGFLLGEERMSIGDYYGGQPEVIATINRFLRLLSEKAKHKPLEVLSVFCAFLEANPKKLANVPDRMVEEERAFGLWWSIIAAYERGDWPCMIAKTEDLMRLAEELGRPFLLAIARAYKAQAFCRTGKDEDTQKAYRELEMVPKDSQLFSSGLVDRLRAKVLRRQGKIDEALKNCKQAEELMIHNKRDDALFLLEKAKLLRYIGVLYSRLAGQITDCDSPDRQRYIKKSNDYFERCENAIAELEKDLVREAMVEKMLLTFAKAYHFEIQKSYEESYKHAEMSMKWAQKLKDENYCTKVKMFLVHVLMNDGKNDIAARFFGELLPLRNYKNTRLERYCNDWVVPYKSELSE